MNIQLSLKVLPHKASKKEVYDKVNEVIKTISKSNLKYIVGPSETTIEGEYDAVFNLVKIIHTQLVADEIEQITMIIMTDYNIHETYIDEKLENVETYLGQLYD